MGGRGIVYLKLKVLLVCLFVFLEWKLRRKSMVPSFLNFCEDETQIQTWVECDM